MRAPLRILRSAAPAALMILAAVLLAVQAGCGSKGPARYPLSGEVTYGGKPVAAGTILFEPDTAQGNDGPGAFVEFTGGHYETPSGKGTTGGPHVVRIVGYSGVPDPSGEAPNGLPVFSEYTTKADLPREKASRNFEVPASHR